jgi:hypothetical protein
MTQIYYRKCSACGRGMNEGYLADYQYFCSDKCLHTAYSPQAWEVVYDGGANDDFYWTEWEERDYPDSPVYTREGAVI